jgi:hypothetical protein
MTNDCGWEAGEGGTADHRFRLICGEIAGHERAIGPCVGEVGYQCEACQ